jgi:hypothetical protein
MPPRWQQFANSWQMYVATLAGLGILTEGLTSIFSKTSALQAAFHDLSSEVRWGIVAVLAIVTITLFCAALRRRSVLQKPERFIISAGDPRYLVGREEHIQKLTDACTRAPLVFLIGESGAGKSALIQAGLLPRLRTATTPEQVLPLRIDASPMEWQRGVRDAVTQALHHLSEEEWKVFHRC